MPLRKYDGTIVHTGKDCTISFANEAFVYGDLKNAFSDGAKVTVEIKSRRKPRSLGQNSLFHMYCGIIADETGNDLETVKNTLKAMFLQRSLKDKNDNDIVNPQTGEVAYYIEDTRNLSTIEMAELTENTRLWALEWFNIELPLPDQNLKINFK